MQVSYLRKSGQVTCCAAGWHKQSSGDTSQTRVPRRAAKEARSPRARTARWARIPDTEKGARQKCVKKCVDFFKSRIEYKKNPQSFPRTFSRTSFATSLAIYPLLSSSLRKPSFSPSPVLQEVKKRRVELTKMLDFCYFLTILDANSCIQSCAGCPRTPRDPKQAPRVSKRPRK